MEAQKENEILIFDRGWLTGMITIIGSVLPPSEKEAAIKQWETLLLKTIFIHTAPENTLNVRQKELTFQEGLTDKKTVNDDYVLRLNLIQKYQPCVITQVETFPLRSDKQQQQLSLKQKLVKEIL